MLPVFSLSECNAVFHALHDAQALKVDTLAAQLVAAVLKALFHHDAHAHQRGTRRFEKLHPGYKIGKNIIYSGETLPEPINGVRYINYKDIAPYFTEEEKYIPRF